MIQFFKNRVNRFCNLFKQRGFNSWLIDGAFRYWALVHFRIQPHEDKGLLVRRQPMRNFYSEISIPSKPIVLILDAWVVVLYVLYFECFEYCSRSFQSVFYADFCLIFEFQSFFSCFKLWENCRKWRVVLLYSTRYYILFWKMHFFYLKTCDDTPSILLFLLLINFRLLEFS